jgi:hypothetical protein
MTRILLAALALPTTLMASALLAQAPRSSACVAANDQVTRLRLGKDRLGKPNAVDVAGAVAAGDAAAGSCRADSAFLLAYALARIDLSSDVKRAAPMPRAAMFNAALTDLETIKALVLAGRSDRYEIFDILALIYYNTGQFAKAVAVTDASTPIFAHMSPVSRQKTLITRGLAQAQLGQTEKASASLDLAAKNGYAHTAELKRKMLITK